MITIVSWNPAMRWLSTLRQPDDSDDEVGALGVYAPESSRQRSLCRNRRRAAAMVTSSPALHFSSCRLAEAKAQSLLLDMQTRPNPGRAASNLGLQCYSDHDRLVLRPIRTTLSSRSSATWLHASHMIRLKLKRCLHRPKHPCRQAKRRSRLRRRTTTLTRSSTQSRAHGLIAVS
jgi:hypothetical protein